MNPDQPSREQIEVRITALLLGELPAEEAELLRWTISQDAELQKLHDRLKSAIGFVREAVKPAADTPASNEAPLKLSPERRHMLLAHFKTPRPKQPFLLRQFRVRPLVAAFAAVAIVATLAALLLPSLAASKRKAQRFFGGVNSLSGGVAMQSASDEQSISLSMHRPVRAKGGPPPPAPVVAPPVAEAPAAGLVMQRVALPQPATPSTAGGTYSQTVVGYTPITLPNNPSAPSTTPADSLSVGNSGVINSFAGGSGGGGGGGGATAPNSTIFAWDASGADRSRTEGQPNASGGTTAFGGVGGEKSFNAKLSLEASDHGVLAAGMDSRTKAANPSGALSLSGNNSPAGGTTLAGGLPENEGMIPDKIQANRKAANDKNRDQNVSAFELAKAKPQPAAQTISRNQALQSLEQDKITAKGFFQTTNAITLNYDAVDTSVTRDDANGLRTLNRAGSSAGSVPSKSPAMPAALKVDQPNVAPAATATLPAQSAAAEEDKLLPATRLPSPAPQPETLTRDNAFSTFSLNVSDVSFKLAAASLEKGRMPDAASIRTEEFINAFDYRDPEAAAGQPLAFTAERTRFPFAHNRDLLRFSVKTAAAGRPAGRALNLVLLLDTSGSMERADRVAIVREALRVLATQLQPQDTVSVVTFARTARLWADGVAGDKAGETLEKIGDITPEGGTNLEEAMRLAYETARRHYLANGLNRVVMLTDGAANLGNVDPGALKANVEANRKQGIALDCFGIGWEDYNDDLLEQLTSTGDGRYAFINSPDEAAGEFAGKLAGALQVAAQDVKVQVEFNPQRVFSWRQIGYAKHQLTQEQFRDNTVAAGAIAAREAGNALYTIETNPNGAGPIATVRVRYRVPGTPDYRERSWDVPYTGAAPALEQSGAAMRLAAVAAEFSEWLAASPFAAEVAPDQLLGYLSGVPEVYGADQRPANLAWMIRQAKSVSGK